MLVSVKRVKRLIFQLAEQTNDWAQAGLRGRVAHDYSSKLIAVDKLTQPLQIKVPFVDEDAPTPQQQSTRSKGKKSKPTPKEYILTIEYIQDIETQSLLRYVPFLPPSQLGLCGLSETAKRTNSMVRVSPASDFCIRIQSFAAASFHLVFHLV